MSNKFDSNNPNETGPSNKKSTSQTDFKINTKKRNTIIAIIIAIVVITVGTIFGINIYRNNNQAPTVVATADEGQTVETEDKTEVETTEVKTEDKTEVESNTEPKTTETKPETTQAPTTQTTEPTTEVPTPTTEATHTHTWTTETYYTTETVHHDAVTHTENKTVVDKEAWDEVIHHDAVTESHEVWHCDCGYSTSDPAAFRAHWSSCGSPSYTSGYETVEVQPAWDETVHHDAQTHTETVTVTDKPAWDETVQVPHTRQVCSECGATK